MLKNYTSGISVERSINFIEQKLVAHGALKILKEYDSKKQISGLTFAININGSDLPFKLPARVGQCERVLKQNLSRRARPETVNKISEQAARTAWKILADWVDAQMAMVELSQVEVVEIFMPYLYDANKQRTLFESFKERGFKALPGACNE